MEVLVSEAKQLKNVVCPKCSSQKFYKDGAVVIDTNHYKFEALKITCENGHEYWYSLAEVKSGRKDIEDRKWRLNLASRANS